MKRIVILSLLFVLIPHGALAQDRICSSGTENLQGATKQCLVKRYEGRSCLLTCRAIELGPDSPSPQCQGDAGPGVYAATETAVFDTCGGLGCLVPSDVQSNQDGPVFGACGKATTSRDCAGQKAEDGLCGERHKKISSEPIYPARFMVTGMASADSGVLRSDTLTTDVTTGVLVQGGFHSARNAALPDGGRLHYDLPWLYWHLAGFVGRDRVGLDAQVVAKTGGSIISRTGAGALGHRTSASELIDTQYRIGPVVHLEIYYNILVQAAWLGFDCDGSVKSGGWSCPDEDHGPAWMIGLSYSVHLWDDFRSE